MAKTPAFDREQVVQEAMMIFWREGYQGASLRALGEAMGLQPGSIYAAFGSKEALFREALAAYVGRVHKLARTSDTGPRALLERWFSKHVEAALDGGNDSFGRGCLLLNSTVEATHVEDATAQMIHAEVDNLERFFRACVTKARRAGGVARQSPGPTATARLLIAALVGISSLSRAGVGRRALEDIARTALRSV